MYEEHRASDILSAVEPDSDQTWNANEVGFDPKVGGGGGWQRVLTSSKEQRLFRTTTGEKAPLWVTASMSQEPRAGVSFPLHSYMKAPNCQNSRRWDFRATGSCMLHHPVTRTAMASLSKVCTEFVEYLWV